MNDELRERLNAFRALSAFASSEDVQWLVDRVEEAEARAADLADRELTALRTMEKAIKELAERDAKLAAVETQLSRWNLACRCNCVHCSQMFAAVRAAASGQEG